MKLFSLFLILFVGLFCIQCNREEEEEDLYYEPLIEGIFNIDVDQNQVVAFKLEPNQPVSVKGQFDNGINFTIEFPADALKFYEKVEAKISPVIQIQNLPPEFQFQFGFVFTPEGVPFNKPGLMTIELPSGIDIGDFKGFYFQGGDPTVNMDSEIWSVKMTPVLYKSINGKKHAVIEIPHFSGFAGVSGGDFNCGNPRAADMCEDLKEILACYIVGKETLTSEDRNKVNNALRIWLDEGLTWLEQNPSEIDEEWEIEYAISELLCWKSSALMFNSNLSSFDDILNRAGSIFTEALINKLIQEDNLCSADPNVLNQRASFELNFSLINLIENLNSADILTENIDINQFNFCNSIATRLYVNPFLDTANKYISADHELLPFYTLKFPKELSPAVARSISFKVYAKNLLGQEAELALGDDFTLSLGQYNQGFLVNGLTLTEEIQTCYVDNWAKTGPYPCYPVLVGRIDIILNDSQEPIVLTIKREL